MIFWKGNQTYRMQFAMSVIVFSYVIMAFTFVLTMNSAVIIK